MKKYLIVLILLVSCIASFAEDTPTMGYAVSIYEGTISKDLTRVNYVVSLSEGIIGFSAKPSASYFVSLSEGFILKDKPSIDFFISLFDGFDTDVIVQEVVNITKRFTNLISNRNVARIRRLK